MLPALFSAFQSHQRTAILKAPPQPSLMPMRKSLKIAGAILGALVLLVLIAAVAAPLFIDANDFKPRIQSAVEEATGRQIDIPGEIDLSVFPWLGANIGAVQLGQAEGFGEQPFAAIEGVQVRVKLLPLLARRIEIDKVVLLQPTIRLIVAEDGRTNWEDLLQQQEAPAEETTAEEETSGPPDFSVDGIEIRNAHVIYDDAASGQQAELADFSFVTGRVALPADFPLEASGIVRLQPQALDARFELVTQVMADLEAETYALRDGRLTLSAQGDSLPVSPLETRLEWRTVDADLAQQVAAISEFAVTAFGVNLGLDAEASGVLDAPVVNGKISFTAGDLSQTARLLGELLPEGVTLSGQARGDASFEFDQKQGAAQVPEFVFRALGLVISGRANATQLNTEQPRYEGNIDIKEFSPGQLMVRLGQELPASRDGTVLDSASFSASFNGTPRSVVLDGIKATLDQSTLQGRLEVVDIERQALRFRLALDQIDVDRYLPPSEAPAAEEAGAAAPLDEMRIPADLVRGLDVDGRLSIGQLKAFSFNSRDIQVGINAKNDVLRVHPIQASFYGGGYSGDMRLDASRDVPRISLDEHVERIQFAPLMNDLFGSEKISGTAAMNVTANASGATVGELRKTLSGNFDLDVSDGAVEGFNLWESIREAYAKLRRREYAAPADTEQRTEFAELSASGTMEGGVIRNDDLTANLPFLRIAGGGSIDIADETLDYTVRARLVNSPELQGEFDELAGMEIPVRLSGELASPRVLPDIGSALQERARQAVDEKKEEVRSEVEEKVEEEKERVRDRLRDRLKDLRD